jgi:hypothetical protein
VEIISAPQDCNEDPDDTSWAAAVAAEWQVEWIDPLEDTYTVEDGVPISRLRCRTQ